MKKQVRCMFRMDDITPDMNWDKFNQVKDIFFKYDICPLIGVVPSNRDETLHKQDDREDFKEVIHSLQERGWKVAQHGTYHCYETKDSGILGINPFSEFAGLPYETQLQKLQEGKALLEEQGIYSDIFMAPGHTYDKNTIKALVACGFTTVTDGLYKTPYYDGGLLFIPCRMQGYKKIKGIDTVCLHTNHMSEWDMAQLEQFCRERRDDICAFEPKMCKEFAVKRSFGVAVYEKGMLAVRKGKGGIANSKRLAWYMNYTNHKNSKVKWLKRIVFFPLLLFYRKDKE